MLMSIPITLSTGAFLALKVARSPLGSDILWQSALGAVLAFVAAYAALALMMRFLSAVSFTPYVIYRLILGAGLLVLAYA
jgi:undecaprenyl-diphosphatase